MTCLYLDTSSELGIVGLTFPTGEVKEVSFIAGKEGGSNLLPLCKSLLEECNLSFKDLSALVVGVGPGSFTGIRVAVSVVQGFSLATKLPIYPISSLYFFCSKQAKDFVVMHDARRGDVYACVAKRAATGEIIWGQPFVQEIVKLCSDTQLPKVWVGPNMEQIASEFPDGVKIESNAPSVSHLKPLIQEMKSKGEFLKEPPIPQSYLRGVVSPKLPSTT